MFNEITNNALFNLNHTVASQLFRGTRYPFEVVTEISAFIVNYGKTLPTDQYYCPTENVWLHNSCTVALTAHVDAPCIIGANSQVRHCAYIRGAVIVGENCVVGNSTEVKNSILFDNVQIPHYNYVGDSILGYRSHLGAGVITSNVKSDKSLVTVKGDGLEVATSMKKFGAAIGDNVEVGCNCVLCPGTIIGRGVTVYPLSMVRGVIKANSIYKSALKTVPKS